MESIAKERESIANIKYSKKSLAKSECWDQEGQLAAGEPNGGFRSIRRRWDEMLAHIYATIRPPMGVQFPRWASKSWDSFTCTVQTSSRLLAPNA